MTPAHLHTLIEAFSDPSREKLFLVVTRTEPEAPLEQYFPEGASVEWLCHVHSAEDLVAIDRADLSIVFDQLEHMPQAEGVFLLSRLRDRYSRRVLIHCARAVYTQQELLALGFVQQECPIKDGCVYVFDPDIFFERREWNTPDKWAHPENFRKYRW